MPTVTHTVSSLMTPNPVVVDWRAGLDEAYRILQRFPFRHLPVVEGETLIGVVSDHDLFHAALVLQKESGRGRQSLQSLCEGCPVGDVIRSAPETVSTEDSHARVVRLMLDNEIDALPVTSDGRLVGIVTSTDLIDSFVDLCLEHGSACDAQVIRYTRRTFASMKLDLFVRDAIEAMDADLGHALVLCDGEVVGVVSLRELRLGLMRELISEPMNGMESPLRLSDVISNTANSVEPGSRLSRAALRMVADEIGALPVARMERPVGLISRKEILQHYFSCL